MQDDFAKRLHAARRARGLSQAELADQLGVSQPAISQFESGLSSLGLESRIKAARILGLELAPAALPAESTDFCLAYCSEPTCPMNVPFLIGEDVRIRPTMVEVEAAEVAWCPECGGKLSRTCPGCRRALAEGGHCQACRAPFVSPATSDRGRAMQMRDEIEDLRRLTSTRRRSEATEGPAGKADDGQTTRKAQAEARPRRARNRR